MGRKDVLALAYHPKGAWLAVGDAGGRLTIWETKGWTLVAECALEGKPEGVRTIRVEDRGKSLLVAAGAESLFRIDVSDVD